MKESDIIQYIESPGLLKHSDIKQLKELLNEFPFYQTAHVLLLKSLKTQKSDLFENQLAKSSIHILDRDILFKFLNKEFEDENIEKPKSKSNDKLNNPIAENKNPKLLKNKNIKRKINDSFEGMGENISETISSQLEFSLVKQDKELEYPSAIYFIEEERNGENNIITIDANPDDPTKDNKKKDILYIDEVKIDEEKKQIEKTKKIEDTFELIETEKIEKSEAKKQNGYFDIKNYADNDVLVQKDDLISKFIEKNPRIKPKEGKEENSDISIQSIQEDTDLLSETLVKVYIKQALFEKAIQSYKKLSLKYPEKSTYFASQIKMLEQKIK